MGQGPHSASSGVFITFEGGEGVGKTTHIGFLSFVLSNAGYEVVTLREPGGTAIGETLRSVVLDPSNDAMADTTELLIYEAARAQLVAEVIRPALSRGAVVLCDRFIDSTIAYQAYGRGLDIASVQAANRFATDGVTPDRTLILICSSAADGLARATNQCDADRIESESLDFHERVNAAFLKIAEEEPHRVKVVDSSQSESDTARLIMAELSDLFPGVFDHVDADAVFYVLHNRESVPAHA